MTDTDGPLWSRLDEGLSPAVVATDFFQGALIILTDIQEAIMAHERVHPSSAAVLTENVSKPLAAAIACLRAGMDGHRESTEALNALLDSMTRQERARRAG
ncbi:MAG: hypothetical protein RLO50_14535 [Azospirillaceae bacterium]